MFCFACNKCVMQDGSSVPGEEPMCMADDQDVCFVDGKLICAQKDDCVRIDVKFALTEHRSLADFFDGYVRQKSIIESSLEAAIGATPSQIYAVKLQHMDDGSVFVTARADTSLQPMLETVFNDRHQLIKNSYGNTIGIDWDRSYPPEIVDPHKTECGPNQWFCFLTGRCIDDTVTMETPCGETPEDRADDSSSELCRPGQWFCFLTGRCIDDTVTMETPCGETPDDRADDSSTEHCRPGQWFCFLTGRCIDDTVTMETPCGETPEDRADDSSSEHCRPGQWFCFLTGRCIDDTVTTETPCGEIPEDREDDSSSEHCRPGQWFCFLTGRCIDDTVTMETPCGETPDDRADDSSSEHCRPGQWFCFLTGRCIDDTVTMETPCGEISEDREDDSSTEHCRPGQWFCFLTGRCIDDTVTMETPCGETPEDRADGSSSEHCRPGQTFCFLTERCVDDHVTMDTPCADKEHDIPSEHCHHGQRFCFLTGRCVDEYVTMETPCDERADDTPPDDSPSKHCHPGQRFCFFTEQCVDDTVTMDTPCDNMDDDKPPDDYSPREYCHYGQRFCFLTERCVDDTVTMDTPCDETEEKEDYKDDYFPSEYCHEGQTFCFLTGQCRDDWTDLDGTCPCSMGMTKCYSDDTKECKWGHECQYKQAVITADGDFSMVEHNTDRLVAMNTDILKVEGGLRELQYMVTYPGSIVIALRSSDIRILTELPRLIREGKFPVDLNGDPLNVLEYKVWDEWTLDGEHKLSINGEWMDYEYPTHCYAGQRFCFMSGKCVSDAVVPELDGGCLCSNGQVKCVIDEDLKCVDYDQCFYLWTVLEMEGDFSTIENDVDELKEKAWASLLELGVKHLQDLNFYSGSIMLYVLSSDMRIAEIMLQAIKDGLFPLALDDTLFTVRSLTYAYIDDSENAQIYYSNNGEMVKYEDNREHCSPGQMFCFMTGRCIDVNAEGDIMECPEPPDLEKAGSCPVVPPGTLGTCVHLCKGDTDCSGSQKCCSNGCGRTCVYPQDAEEEGPKEHCHEGQMFCFLSGRCIGTTNSDTAECPAPTVPTEPKEEGPKENCHPGQTFCFMSGKCLDADGCPHPTEPPREEPPKEEGPKEHCHAGQTFCFMSGKCLDATNLCDEVCTDTDGCSDPTEPPREEPPKEEGPKEHCHAGQTFCFMSGKCLDVTNPCDEVCTDTDGCIDPTQPPREEGPKEHCHAGQTFCLWTEKCVDDVCDSICPDGKVVCESRNNECVDEAECTTDTVDSKDDRPTDDTPAEHCTKEQTFCLWTGKCVDDACVTTCPEGKVVCESRNNECVDEAECTRDTVNNVDDDEDDAGVETPAEHCTKEQMFCFYTGKCVDQVQTTCDTTDTTDTTCPAGEVLCVSQNNVCLDLASCQTFIVSVTFDADYTTVVGDNVSPYNTFVEELLSTYIPFGSIIGITTTSGSIISMVETTVPVDDLNIMIREMEANTETPIEYNGHTLNKPVIAVVDESEDDQTCLDPDKPVWCETTESCVAEGQCNVVPDAAPEKEVFVIWASLSGEQSLFELMAASDTTQTFEDQINAFKQSTKSSLQSVVDTASVTLTFTGVSVIPADRDGSQVAIVAVAEAASDAVTSSALQTALTDANIGSNLQLTSVEVWLTLGASAAVQIFPSRESLVYDKDVVVDVSFLPDEILSILTTPLALSCSTEEGVMIKDGDNYVERADFTSTTMTLKATTETAKFAKCEILNIPANIIGTAQYYIGLMVLPGDMMDLPKISGITARDIEVVEDSDCQRFPEDLFTFQYKGDAMLDLVYQPKWPQRMLDAQESWFDPLQTLQAIETQLLQFVNGVKMRRSSLRVSVSLNDGVEKIFNSEKVIKFRYIGTNLEAIENRPAVLTSPQSFQYCIASDFSGSLQLDVSHKPSMLDGTVTSIINIQVNPVNDKPVIRTNVEDITSDFSYPKVSDTNQGREFTAGDLAALWYSDIDMVTDTTAVMGLAVLGADLHSNTVGGQWEYKSSSDTTWQVISNAPSNLDQTADNSVQVLLLRPTSKIRFTPDSKSLDETWEITRSPSLALFAWDVSNLASITDLTQASLVVQKCRKSVQQSLDMFCVQGSDAYSHEIKIASLPREGCDEIPGSGMVVTQCGCGLTADSCVDCNNVVNGEAEKDKCGICSGGQTGLVPKTEINCEDTTCRSNNLNYCESKEEALATFSRLCPESQRPNKCYNKTSTLYKSCTSETVVPVDACGITCGLNECLDCEETPNGGKLLNPCGQCKDPDSLNEGCVGLGDIFPDLSYTHGTLNMSARISEGLVVSDTTPISCQLVPKDPVEGQVAPEISNIKYASGTIRFTTKVSVENKANSAGVYAVQCEVDETVVSSADSEQFYLRYMNPSLSTLVPEQIPSGTEMIVTITGTGFHDTGEIYCIIPYDNNEYLNVMAKRLSDTQVTCNLAKVRSKLQGTSYSLYVILNKPKTMSQELGSLTNPLSFTVKLLTPVLVSAKFNAKNCHKINIKFNVRISGPPDAVTGDCSTYFDAASMEIILADATCTLSGGKLVLKTTASIPINTELTLKNIKQEKETSTTPNYYTGNVIITEDADMSPPTVYINPAVSNTIGCKKQRVKIIIKNKQCWNAAITWTAFAEDATEVADQEKLTTLNTFLTDKQEFTLQKDQLPDVPVNFSAEWTLTEERTKAVVTGSEFIVIRKVDSIALSIRNVDKLVTAKSALKPRGVIKGCFADSDAEIIPTWTLEPEGIYNQFKDQLKVVIKKGVLPGNMEFNLTLTVSVGAKPFSKSFIFTTTSIPPVAAIEYKGTIASEEVEAFNGENHELVCKNVAEDADPNAQINYVWTGIDNQYDGDLTPIIDASSDAILEYFTPQITLDWTQIEAVELIQQWTCAIQQDQYISEATTMLVFKDPTALPPPVIRSRVKSTEIIQIKEGDESIKIRVFCKDTTNYEWYSTIETEEEMLITGTIKETITKVNNNGYGSCGVKIDLSGKELSPDLDYPLTLKAINSRDGQEVVTSRDFKLEYLTKPIGGTIEAIYDVNEGNTITAYTGLVSFVLDNWNANSGEDTDLKCKIYYSKTGSGKKRRLTTSYISVDEFVDDAVFPEGEFTVEATCCNPKDLNNLCTTVTMADTLVSVKAPELTDFLNILDVVALKLRTGDQTFVGAIVDIMMNVVLTLEERARSDEIAASGIAEELRLANEVSTDEPGEAIESLVNINEIAGTSVTLDDATISDIYSVAKDTARSLTGQVSKNRRRKRDTTTSTASGMTVGEAEILLGAFDNLITDDPVNKETAEAFKEVIDLALLGLCQAYTGTTPWVAGSDFTTVRVSQTSLSGQATAEFDVSCGSCTNVTNPAKVVYGADIVAQYGDADICVASGQILVDTYTLTGTGIELIRMSDLVILKFINVDGFSTETVSGMASQSVKITLVLNNSTINSTAYDYKCKMWASTGTWSDDECSTSDPVLDGGTSKYSVQCSCNALGIVGVFQELKPDDSVSTTTTSTTTSTTTPTTTTVTVTTTTAAPSVPLAVTTDYVTVGWTFTNAFGSEVTDETTFKSNLKSQLDSQFDIPSASCRNMEIKSGSILVSFDLYAYSSSTQTLGQMLYSLQNGINTITITNSNGNTLVVQGSTFYYQEVGANLSDSDGDTGNLGIIIGASLGGLIIIGLVVVAVVFIVKKYAQPKTHPVSRQSSPGSQGYGAPPAYVAPAYGAPPPPPYLYEAPTAPEPPRPYPVSNKWIENELYKGRKPTESGSRPNSTGSTHGLLSDRKGTNSSEPTPVG